MERKKDQPDARRARPGRAKPSLSGPPLARIFLLPVIILILSLDGLILALALAGPADIAAVTAAASPLAAIAWALLRR